VWLIGALVCLLAAPLVQLSVSAGNRWSHNALQHHWIMPISCHFRDCKALLVTSLTHVCVAIASVQTFTFTFSSSRDVPLMMMMMIMMMICLLLSRFQSHNELLNLYQLEYQIIVTYLIHTCTSLYLNNTYFCSSVCGRNLTSGRQVCVCVCEQDARGYYYYYYYYY